MRIMLRSLAAKNLRFQVGRSFEESLVWGVCHHTALCQTKGHRKMQTISRAAKIWSLQWMSCHPSRSQAWMFHTCRWNLSVYECSGWVAEQPWRVIAIRLDPDRDAGTLSQSETWAGCKFFTFSWGSESVYIIDRFSWTINNGCRFCHTTVVVSVRARGQGKELVAEWLIICLSTVIYFAFKRPCCQNKTFCQLSWVNPTVWATTSLSVWTIRGRIPAGGAIPWIHSWELIPQQG